MGVVRFLQFLVLAVLVQFAWRAARRWLEGGEAERLPRNEPRGGTTIYGGVMVKDPVCGLHVPEDRAVVAEHDGQRYHFCSEKCRNAFKRAS